MIKVEHDGSGPEDGNEQCCFCLRPTRYWYARKDVAVCPSCAAVRSPREVPSKEQWCADIDAVHAIARSQAPATGKADTKGNAE